MTRTSKIITSVGVSPDTTAEIQALAEKIKASIVCFDGSTSVMTFFPDGQIQCYSSNEPMRENHGVMTTKFLHGLLNDSNPHINSLMDEFLASQNETKSTLN